MAPHRSGVRTQDHPVSDLLEWIADQDLVLPEFQRDYDWDDERVIALVATMMRGWPAGSLLLQEVEGPTFFSLRPFEGGPPIDEHRASLVVLDGQQRLTALYQALYDAGPSVYAIKASAIEPNAGIDQLEESMHAFDRSEWDQEHRNSPLDSHEIWIPLFALRSAADYFAWRDEAANRSDEPERFKLTVTDAYRNGLEGFQKYRFPNVNVERGLEPAAIARIFERVNRQGLVLKTFDLMVARTFVQDWNLRDRWSEARVDHPVLDRFFGDDGMPVIRAIALATVGNVREQAVLTLEPGTVRMQWPDAVEAMARAVSFLETRCGVSEPAWIPYGTMIITLAAIERAYRLEDKRTLVLRWFLSRSLGLRYETGANTVAVEEYRHLEAVFKDEETLRKVEISKRVLLEATRKRQGAIWRSFMCCLSMAGAVKVGLGGTLGEPAMTPTPLFPKLSTPKGLEPQHQLVLNLVLTDRLESREFGHAGLQALVEHLEMLKPTVRSRVERTQLIKPDLSGETTTREFVALRLGELEKWLKPKLGYGFE